MSQKRKCRVCGVLRRAHHCRNIDSMAAERNPAYAEHDVFHRGDRLRKARELAGHPDLKAFAAATGIDRGALGRYESTGDIPRKSTLKQLVLATGVREAWLETGKGRMYNSPGDPDNSHTLRTGNLRPTLLHVDFAGHKHAA